MSPRKVRLIVEVIKGLFATEALKQLQFSSKHAAQPVIKLLNSAIANAVHNYHATPDSLIIKNAFVDGGSILYRWMPRAMGRATPIRKRTSHVTIVLNGMTEAGQLGNEKRQVKAKEKAPEAESAENKK